MILIEVMFINLAIPNSGPTLYKLFWIISCNPGFRIFRKRYGFRWNETMISCFQPLKLIHCQRCATSQTCGEPPCIDSTDQQHQLWTAMQSGDTLSCSNPCGKKRVKSNKQLVNTEHQTNTILLSIVTKCSTFGGFPLLCALADLFHCEKLLCLMELVFVEHGNKNLC